ncbi:MAG: hypothetical protein MJ180_01295 [Candidatus Gastranaerophilales bacterium]|nr:hypothetical protein [Candidatus Gastranaerophilales bacterium]
MQINSISNNNFGMNWKQATIVAKDKLTIAECVAKLTTLAPKKNLYFKEIGDTMARKMDDGVLGYLHFFDAPAFCYKVGGKKYPPEILEGIEKCINAKNAEEAKNIANALIDKHNAMLNVVV